MMESCSCHFYLKCYHYVVLSFSFYNSWNQIPLRVCFETPFPWLDNQSGNKFKIEPKNSFNFHVHKQCLLFLYMQLYSNSIVFIYYHQYQLASSLLFILFGLFFTSYLDLYALQRVILSKLSMFMNRIYAPSMMFLLLIIIDI